MNAIKSISKPSPGGLESAAGKLLEVRIETHGSPGPVSEETSRASRFLIARGKSDSPIPRPTSVLESVIGVDQRQRVLDTDLHPWRMICSLAIQAPNGARFVGSGWFIGSKAIATAGHCVFDNLQMGGWAESITVMPGRNESISLIEPFKTARFSATNCWVDSRDPDFDIGCIHLDDPLGEDTGWFGAASIPATDLTGFLVNVAGYPADLASGTQMYHHRNRVLRVSDRRMFYDVDTFGGQSGAPVWIHESDDGPPIAVGIHAYGIGGTPGHFNIEANSAPRLIPEVLELFQTWTDGENG